MFLERFKQFITTEMLFKSNEKILLAVSGGKDSVLMAHFFKLLGFSFGIIHCNFCLRQSESDRDEQFVKQLAVNFKVPFFAKKFETLKYAEENQISIQMAARELRYSYFEEVRLDNNYAKIAVAQHQNDAIETILLNLIRGTGIAGLHGILANRGNIIRPMLCYNQNEIDQIVDNLKISYVEDSSNKSSKYMRNFIRQNIVPNLKSLNQNLEQTFEKNIKHFSQLEIFFQQQVDNIRAKLFLESKDGYKIAIKNLEDLHPKQLIIYELFKPFHFNSSVIESLMHNLNKHSGREFFSSTHQILIDREYVFLRPLSDKRATVHIWNNGVKNICVGDIIFSVHSASKLAELDFIAHKMYIDSEKLIYPLIIRNWREGDKFVPFGMKKFKKLSDFFVSEKLSIYEKQKMPLLINGNGDIIWVCGLRSDNRYKINEQTEKISIFEMQSA